MEQKAVWDAETLGEDPSFWLNREADRGEKTPASLFSFLQTFGW